MRGCASRTRAGSAAAAPTRGGRTTSRRPRPSRCDALAAAMRPQWQMIVQLAAYCQLRFGELAELRRKDVELDGGRGVLRVRRAMSRVDGAIVTGPPKSGAGIRDVAIPPHLLGELAAHLAAHCGPGRDALLFTTPRGAQLYHAVLYREWKAARDDGGPAGVPLPRPEAHRDDLAGPRRRHAQRADAPGRDGPTRGWRRGTSTPTPSGTRRTPNGSPAARRSSCRWPPPGADLGLTGPTTSPPVRGENSPLAEPPSGACPVPLWSAASPEAHSPPQGLGHHGIIGGGRLDRVLSDGGVDHVTGQARVALDQAPHRGV